MKIALFGASGTIGTRILSEALRRGHTVTAVARDPARVSAEHQNLKAVHGDVLDAESIASAVAGHDAVISAYGPGGSDVTKVVDATRAFIEGLKKAGVKRFVMVGGAGSLEVAPGVQILDAPDFPEAFRSIALAHRDALEVLLKEGGELDWTNLSPAAVIEPGKRTGTFRVGGDQLLSDAAGDSRISAEDYAIALLDEVEHPHHVRRRFTVAY